MRTRPVRAVIAIAVLVLSSCVSQPGAHNAPPPTPGAQAPPPAPQPAQEHPPQPAEQPPPQAAEPVGPAPAPPPPAQVPPPSPVQPDSTPSRPPAPRWVEVSPGLRVCRELRTLEVDGTVPIDVHGKAPRVFLEVLVCSRDTREHEALVVTDVKPSSVHAALLMLGLQPGAPGSWQFEHATLTSTPPTGPAVNVRVKHGSGEASITEPIESWVANLRGGQALADRDPAQHMVFAGSRFVNRDGIDTYAADADGTLVGLTAFGSETVAWTAMYHPDSAFEQPQWIADPAKVPAFGTKVTVLISAP